MISLKFYKYNYFNLALKASTILNVAGQIATFLSVKSDLAQLIDLKASSLKKK